MYSTVYILFPLSSPSYTLEQQKIVTAFLHQILNGAIRSFSKNHADPLETFGRCFRRRTSDESDDAALQLFQGRKAGLRLNIVIVGCGLGGLAAAYCLGRAGHQVTMVEAAPAIGEVGAGIQLGPNLTRLLIRWGLEAKLKEMAVKPSALAFRRCECAVIPLDECTYSPAATLVDQDGERIGWTQWGETMDQAYGAPYYHIHVRKSRKVFERLTDVSRASARTSTNCSSIWLSPT